MNLFDGIRKNNFLVIGRVGIDFYPDPPGTKTEDAKIMSVGMGGSSANIAAGIVKLNGKAALLTSISDDSIGRYCLNQLDQYGIDRKYVKKVGGEARNSLAVYETRVKDHQTVIYRNGAADFKMTAEDVKVVDYKAYGALITAGTVFAAEPSRSAAFKAFELAHMAGLPILFDVDYRPYSWPSNKVAKNILGKAAKLSDAIIGNDEEFGFISGDIKTGLKKARELAKSSAQLVIYKMGENGSITITNDKEFHTGIYPVKALKPTGAGDSFMAGFTSSIAQGYNIKQAVLRGSAYASITVSKPGCAPAMASNSEFANFLSSHPGPTKPKSKI
jgi:5-dehydro-2-deoxygluconokinase